MIGLWCNRLTRLILVQKIGESYSSSPTKCNVRMEYHKREKILFDKGYYVDKQGNLYNPKGEQVMGSIRAKGRKGTCVKINDNKVKHIFFHRMVAYAKYGDRMYDENMVVRHLDGNPLNNSWDNIAIGTQRDNMMDVDEGMRVLRSALASRKYPSSLVQEIRDLRSQGWSYSKLMAKFGISSKGTLSYLVNKRMF